MGVKVKKPLFSGISLEAATLMKEFREEFAYNEWTLAAEVGGKPIDDDKIRELSFWIQSRTGQEWTKEKLWDAVIMLAKERPYNPLVRYLTETVTWDGQDAIQELVTLLQPTDADLAYIYLKRWLISAVRRAVTPGEKADTMLILVGAQGIGKSKFSRALCPMADQGFFLEDFNAKITRDEKMKIKGAWIVEMSELKGMRDASVTSLKSFLSGREDSYRVPWGKVPLIVPRRCVFVGTTNELRFLRDETGDRRFMVIESQTPKGVTWEEEKILGLRDQVWAQAVELNKQGEVGYLIKDEVTRQEESNKLYTEEDPWTGAILQMANFYPELQRPLDALLTGFEFEGMKLKDCGDRERNRVCGILAKAGWTYKALKRDGKTVRVWINPNPPEKNRQFATNELTNGKIVVN